MLLTAVMDNKVMKGNLFTAGAVDMVFAIRQSSSMCVLYCL